MNNHALQSLEFNKIKAILREQAISDLGQHLIDELTPSNHLEKIVNQIKETTEAKNILQKTSAIPLHGLNGIEMIMSKLDKFITLTEEELTAVAKLLKNTRKLKTFMQDKVELAPSISQFALSMFDLADIIEEIERCITNNRIDDSASQTLNKVRKKIYISEGRIKTKLISIIQSPSLKSFLQDSNISIKNNHYVVSVKNEYRKEIPGIIIDRSSTGSTLFIEPEAIGRLYSELTELKSEESNEEYQIRLILTSIIQSCRREININIEALAYYDFVFAKGKYSKIIDGNPVLVNIKGYTSIKEGRHPLLSSSCVPLNFEIGNDYRTLVITGPNTGGKTVALKTVGLLTAMVQSGLHVPVANESHFAIFSDILVDIGDGQSIEQSLSTFSSHIKNIIQIIRYATKYTLVILDEIGAGTDPTEGEGLAIAILEELHKQGSTILATSHYSEVKTYANSHAGFMNGNMLFDIVSLKPLYQLQIGKAGESNAFIIALKLGMSQSIIENAHQITYKEKKDYSLSPMNESIIGTTNNTDYEKTSKQRTLSELDTPLYTKEQIFSIGDLVFVHIFKQRGLIYLEENKKGEYGVMIGDKKVMIHKKRLSRFIDSKELYPADYDFDIVFESKEYRKKNKIMNKRHEEGLTIEYKQD